MTNLEFSTLIVEIERWQRKNFPNAMPWEPLVGMTEELGELSHAHLKQHQGIRGSHEEHQAAKIDAVGDIIIYAIHYCKLNGFTFEMALRHATSEVLKRDWQANPTDGNATEPPATPPGPVGA